MSECGGIEPGSVLAPFQLLSSPAMTEWAKCTWIEARDLLSNRAVALLPIGCTEPHGPHLPLDTDVTIAVAQARRAAELLGSAGVRALVLPPLAYGVTNYTDGFAGRVTIRPGTLWALIEDVIRVHPPRMPVEVESLADLFYALIEGSFVMTKTLADKSLLARHTKHLRNYMELLFTK